MSTTFVTADRCCPGTSSPLSACWHAASLDSPATTKLGAQGYFVTVYSDSEPANVGASEELGA